MLTAYPNPFNGTTTISYSVAVTSSVSIQVYNAMGALVKTLYEHVAEEGQEYTVTFRSDGLPEGVYYYNLRTGNGISITHKLILTK